ncbi:MAG: glycosyltransferase [Oculatellaceae cyanobacterium Prado106]|jgi:glycosyltransferase involved in cell wall biosynthesis|nr:glycosyltransferase [Oculatellaceae cyanobacterium Prado106]
MRVLILAELCNPEQPSLPVVGYQYARAIANHAEVVVATQIRNQSTLQRTGLGKAEVVFIDSEFAARPITSFSAMLRGGTSVSWTIETAMGYPTYLAFEWLVWQQFKQALHQGEFDLVHRITPMSPTTPSPIASFSPVPFLIGPLNGNLPWHADFLAEQRREREWLSKFRNAYKLLPFARSTYRDSKGILAAFDHTIADLPPQERPKMINFPEVGIDPALFNPPQRQIRPDQPMTILFAGRLVPYKMPEVVVRAVANSPLLQKHRLVIVGEGPERIRLEALIQEYQLEHCVQLLGNQPQSEVGRLMREAEIFAFPSIRELGAGVVIEAMACGMACVVVDYGGPATLIGEDRGIKIPMGKLDFLVHQYTHELESLVQDPHRVANLGAAAYDHAMTYYTWDVKAQKTLEIYQWATGQRATKPDFWEGTTPRRMAEANA